MPTYDDSRYIYDRTSLSYDGKLSVPLLGGAQLAPTGTISVRLAARRTLTGAQDYATGAISRRLTFAKTLTSTQLAASGALARLHRLAWGMSGDQPGPTATLTRKAHYLVRLEGLPDEPNGDVTTGKRTYTRALAGAQDPPSALSAVTHHYFVHLTGFQPIVRDFEYEEPGARYNDSGARYEINDPSSLTWHAGRRRALEGYQPIFNTLSYEQAGMVYEQLGISYDEDGGAGILIWKFSPDFWAIYRLSVDGTSDEIGYVVSVDPDQPQYVSTATDERIVYTVRGPRVYTRD